MGQKPTSWGWFQLNLYNYLVACWIFLSLSRRVNQIQTSANHDCVAVLSDWNSINVAIFHIDSSHSWQSQEGAPCFTMQTVVTDKKTALETISILNLMLIFSFATTQLFSVVQLQILVLCSLWVLNICCISVIHSTNIILIPGYIYFKFPLTAKRILTRCQIWCTIEFHRDPISKVLSEW